MDDALDKMLVCPMDEVEVIGTSSTLSSDGSLDGSTDQDTTTTASTKEGTATADSLALEDMDSDETEDQSVSTVPTEEESAVDEAEETTAEDGSPGEDEATPKVRRGPLKRIRKFFGRVFRAMLRRTVMTQA